MHYRRTVEDVGRLLRVPASAKGFPIHSRPSTRGHPFAGVAGNSAAAARRVYSVKCGAGFFDLAKIRELALETEIGGATCY
jgi:hypothetical protein